MVGLERELLWYASVLRCFSREISDFIQLKTYFEGSVLRSDEPTAFSTLSEVKKRFGESLWKIENEFNAISEFKSVEAASKFVADLTAKNNIDPLVSFFSRLLVLRSDRSIPIASFGTTVKARTKSQQFNQYLHFKLCHSQERVASDLESALLFEGSSSLIDRYLTFIKVCRTIIATKSLSKYFGAVWSALEVLGPIPGDNVLTNLRLVVGLSNLIENSGEHEILFPAFNKYVSGEYEALVDYLTNITNTIGSAGERIVLHATALARIEAVKRSAHLPQKNLYSRIVNELAEIALRSARSVEASNNILRTSNIYSSSSWSSFLISYSSLYSIRDRAQASPLSEVYCLLAHNPANPRTVSLYHNVTARETCLRRIEKAVGNQTSIDFYRATAVQGDVPKSSVSIEKANLYLGRRALASKNYREAIALFEPILVSTDLIANYEAVQGAAVSFVALGELDRACCILADAYLNNRRLLNSLPFPELMNEFRKHEYSKSNGNIARSICVDACAKIGIKDVQGIQYSFFEDFLESHGIERPSHLDRLVGRIPKRDIVYFAKEICIPTILDSFPALRGTFEIENERISVCQMLINMDPSLAEELNKEIGTLTKTQFLRTRTREVEKSKIYVNIEGLKKSAETELADQFQIYRMLSKEEKFDVFIHSVLDQLTKNSRTGDGKIPIVISPTAKIEILTKIIEKIRDEFVSGANFGLEGYLSVRIRHGVLSGELRASLERENLISKRNKKRVYEENTHWIERVGLPHEESDKLKLRLAEFSSEIDSVIDFLNDRLIQVRSKSRPEGFFDFEIKLDDIVAVEKSILPNTGFFQFLTLVLDLLWDITDQNLQQIRSYFATEVKSRIDHAFVKLLGLSNELEPKATEGLKDLDASIKRARIQMDLDINRISEWFKRPRESTMPDFQASLPFEAAAQTVRRTHPNVLFKFAADESLNIKLKGPVFESFFYMGCILFENTLAHSGISNGEIETEVTLTSLGDQITLSAANKISREVFQNLKPELEYLEEKVNRSEEIEMVKKEGGSGILKIAKTLKIDLKVSPRISFELTEQNFRISVRFNGKDLICRS